MVRGPRTELDTTTLEQYKRMIYKLAYRSWRQLPTSVKMWVDPDDLAADAYVYVLSWARFHYNRRKASKSTFLWTGISNLFLNYAIKHQSQKRFGWRLSLEDVFWLGKQDKQIAELEALMALARVYKQASEPCKVRIKKWFGQEKVKVRRAKRELVFYEEFQSLASRNGLTRDACRELMRSGVWIP